MPIVAMKYVRLPAQGFGQLQDYLAEEEVTVQVVLLPVDGRLQPRGFHPLSVGTTSHAFAAATEVFRVCVLCCGTRGFVLVHNHLSGRCMPSESDLEVTAQLLAAGRIMGIPLVDHLIVATTGRYHSMHEAGTLARWTGQYGRSDVGHGDALNSPHPEEKR